MGLRRRRQGAGTGRLERFLLSIMGPPQVGDPTAASSVTSDPADDLCRKCGAPWDRHARVRTASHTYATCPAPEQEP